MAEARWQQENLPALYSARCGSVSTSTGEDPATSSFPQLNRHPLHTPARQYGPIWCVSSVGPAWITEANKRVKDTTPPSLRKATHQTKPSPGIRQCCRTVRDGARGNHGSGGDKVSVAARISPRQVFSGRGRANQAYPPPCSCRGQRLAPRPYSAVSDCACSH